MNTYQRMKKDHEIKEELSANYKQRMLFTGIHLCIITGGILLGSYINDVNKLDTPKSCSTTKESTKVATYLYK